MRKLALCVILAAVVSGCAALPPIGWAVVGAVSAGFGAGYIVKDQADKPTAPAP